MSRRPGHTGQPSAELGLEHLTRLVLELRRHRRCQHQHHLPVVRHTPSGLAAAACRSSTPSGAAAAGHAVLQSTRRVDHHPADLRRDRRRPPTWLRTQLAKNPLVQSNPLEVFEIAEGRIGLLPRITIRRKLRLHVEGVLTSFVIVGTIFGFSAHFALQVTRVRFMAVIRQCRRLGSNMFRLSIRQRAVLASIPRGPAE